MPVPSSIVANVRRVRDDIHAACSRVGRNPAPIRIIAVTKAQGVAVLEPLRTAGIRDFGENRLEHLEEMRSSGLPEDRWHYIGRVQGRQLPRIATHAASLHSLCDRGHIERLSRASVELSCRFEVFLQVNVSGEASKSGATREHLPELLATARAAAGLAVVGLMTMAPEIGTHATESEVRACFAGLRELARHHGLERLSMGMSGDYRIAVEEGATDLRLGTCLFAANG